MNSEQSEEFKFSSYSVDMSVENIHDRTQEDEETGQTEIVIPDYQRAFKWPEDMQSYFIESLLLGIPIPVIYALEKTGKQNNCLEIIDGQQRIGTITKFLNNELKLQNLDILKNLNGKTFTDLDIQLKRSIRRKSIKFFIFFGINDEKEDFFAREVFKRINYGTLPLKGIEKSRATDGDASNLVSKLSSESVVRELLLLSETQERSKVDEYLIARFFALIEIYFSNNYENSDLNSKNKSKVPIAELIDSLYKLQSLSKPVEEYKQHFLNIFEIINKISKFGLKKKPGSEVTNSLVFESLTIAIHKILENEGKSFFDDMKFSDKKLGFLNNPEDPEFDTFRNEILDSNGSNAKKKFIQRVNFATQRISGKEYLI